MPFLMYAHNIYKTKLKTENANVGFFSVFFFSKKKKAKIGERSF